MWKGGVDRMRVAVFGAGYFSRNHLDSWARIPGVELVGLCVRSNRDRAEAIAKAYGVAEIFTNPREMMERTNPDLVDIITLPDTHLELVRLSLEYCVPAICQKPLAPTLEEAEQLAKSAEDAGVLVVVHENWRFKPWFREIKALLDQGMVGELYQIHAMLRPGDGKGPEAYLNRQPYFRKMKRFVMHETGIHFVDLMRFYLGEPSGVTARLRRLNPVIAGEDSGLVLLEFDHHAYGVIDANRHADFVADNTFLTLGPWLLEGSEGSIRLDGQARIWLRRPGEAEREYRYNWDDRNYGGDCAHHLQSHVIAHLRGDGIIENPASDYVNNVRIEEAIYRSAEEGHWQALA